MTYQKMDQRVKQRWLKALRSRKYKQGTNALRRCKEGKPDQFCCLGVLCDQLNPGGWEMFVDEVGVRMFMGCSGSVPYTLSDKIKLDDTACEYLVHLNDKKKQKFYQIARWIERNL